MRLLEEKVGKKGVFKLRIKSDYGNGEREVLVGYIEREKERNGVKGWLYGC